VTRSNDGAAGAPIFTGEGPVSGSGPETNESCVVMPRESGASSTPSAIRLCPNRNHVVTGSPAFAGNDRLFNEIIPEQILGADRRSADAVDASGIMVAGVALVADLAGALYWPEERLLVISDLHLEKGSSFAMRGVLLPPYDTASTLERLAGALSRHAVRTVVALGDNFHDQNGPARLAATDRAKLLELQRGRDWVWIAGNHDPDPADRIGGVFARALALGPLVFRHEPTAQASLGEIAGHLHPVARVSRRGRTLTRRCFASDRTRMVMPAFGAYTGGLNIRHAAFVKAFGSLAFTAHLLGYRRLYAFAATRCLADGGP
jgi:DNA ligase-associated metallophosphoesterase